MKKGSRYAASFIIKYKISRNVASGKSSHFLIILAAHLLHTTCLWISHTLLSLYKILVLVPSSRNDLLANPRTISVNNNGSKLRPRGTNYSTISRFGRFDFRSAIDSLQIVRSSHSSTCRGVSSILIRVKVPRISCILAVNGLS